jgi:hypothetical protein
MTHEAIDDRAHRIQDRLRAAGDEEAANLIDDLYGLWYVEHDRTLPTPLAQERIPSQGSVKATNSR